MVKRFFSLFSVSDSGDILWVISATHTQHFATPAVQMMYVDSPVIMGRRGTIGKGNFEISAFVRVSMPILCFLIAMDIDRENYQVRVFGCQKCNI